jgi:hypothetical protein
MHPIKITLDEFRAVEGAEGYRLKRRTRMSTGCVVYEYQCREGQWITVEQHQTGEFKCFKWED